MLTSELMLTNEKLIATFCLTAGVTRILVEFNGGGDSGSIDSIDIEKNGEPYPEDTPIEIWAAGERVFDNGWIEQPSFMKTMGIQAAIEAHVYQALDDTGVDWCNNDGGCGTWEWDSATGLEFSVYQRTVQENLEHHTNRRLGSLDADA